ncbi:MULTISPECIES: sensor histidine kinase [Enterococcus]|uniref:sensor histidine kinase n=1 Tax=Enterococcus TaxID=1350 RepID=UPI0008C99911|nr:HAMP domain-containing sensor histidine kinase [Enterococcus malodoratus]SET77566.1 two-component system, OmpR family, sensor histidine kinase SaeS [Enterococcus malodoratus]
MKLRNMLILSFLTSSIVVVLIVWFSISKMYLTDYDGYLIIGITILANILGTIIGLFSLRNTFHSLDKLSKQTKVIKENQFTEIQLEHAPKELQTLADDFNEMVAALADSFTALEKSEQDKSNLVAQLGHDIKTPITAIKNQIEAIQDGVISKEEIDQTLDQMAFQVERLSSLTKQLMEITIMEKALPQSPANQEQKVWLDQFLLKLLSSFDYILRKKQQKLTLQVDPKVKTLMTDEGKLNRILTNLIENASKYSPANTTIYLKIEAVNGQIIFSIKDEGIGIKTIDQQKIFDRLYRVEKSRNPETGGSGLGLYISKSLTEQLKGELKVESDYGNGSIFRLMLPEI